MASNMELAEYRGWTIVWNPGDYKLYVKKGGDLSLGFGGELHGFDERPRDRVVAIEIAKAWIDRRR